MKRHLKSTSLYGLVLAGGQSTRMRTDKSLLKYHGISQVEYCVKILSKICQKIFVSNRKDQTQNYVHRKYPQICDLLGNFGPIGGILSAMTNHPGAAWFVLACDLPFVDAKVLTDLLKERNNRKMATAYLSTHKASFPDPLCAIYEPNIFIKLLEFFGKGIYCPRQIFENLDINLIRQKNNISLNNVNNRTDLFNALVRIKEKNEKNIFSSGQNIIKNKCV